MLFLRFIRAGANAHIQHESEQLIHWKSCHRFEIRSTALPIPPKTRSSLDHTNCLLLYADAWN